MKRLVSIIVPVFNEEIGIKKFLDEMLLPELKNQAYDFEIVIVNDGSVDRSGKKIRESEILKVYPTRVISFSRNFGKEVALTAGLNNAKGDVAIMIDADGQHPVEAIAKMIEKWENGAKIVTAVRGHNTTKHKMGSKLYYKMMRVSGNKKVVVGAMDFRLLDRVVIDEFNRFTEHNRLTRGLIDWLGFQQEYIKVETRNRTSGKPSYGVKKLMVVAWDSMAASSRTPLVIFGYIGLFITVTSAIFGLFILIQQYILGDPLGLDWSGAVAMSVFVSFLVGLVLISQSITALYISQIHMESKNRPLYVIEKKEEFGKKNG